MRTTTAFALLLLPTLALANPFPKGDAKLGEQLITKQTWNRATRTKTGGDGRTFFTRKIASSMTSVHYCSALPHAALKPMPELVPGGRVA